MRGRRQKRSVTASHEKEVALTTGRRKDGGAQPAWVKNGITRDLKGVAEGCAREHKGRRPVQQARRTETSRETGKPLYYDALNKPLAWRYDRQPAERRRAEKRMEGELQKKGG